MCSRSETNTAIQISNKQKPLSFDIINNTSEVLNFFFFELNDNDFQIRWFTYIVDFKMSVVGYLSRPFLFVY